MADQSPDPFAEEQHPETQPLQAKSDDRPGKKRRVATASFEKLLAPVLAAVLGGVILWLLTHSNNPTRRPKAQPSPQRPSSVPRSSAGPPVFRAMVLGTGTETLRARGFFGDHSFVARSALALNMGYGNMVWIVLFPGPVTCSTWVQGTPEGIYFEVEVDVTPTTLASLPVGRRMRASIQDRWFALTWNTDRGNSTSGQFIDDGFMTLTAIDTNPGGYWRGRIYAPRSRLPNGKLQSFDGTFAAQWCPDPQGAG